MMNMKVLKVEEPTGTDAEALAYLMPASLEAPMGRDWTQIYLYVSTKVCLSAGKEVPEDIRVEELSDYLMHELDRLKAWIEQLPPAMRDKPFFHALGISLTPEQMLQEVEGRSQIGNVIVEDQLKLIKRYR